ncbi:MAG: thiamine diphosphokinase [Pseudomonadota bacterium]
MPDIPLRFSGPITLVGGGALERSHLDAALALAPTLIAADGAADRLAGWNVTPAAVIGDMDSISDPAAWDEMTSEVLRLEEQETTDFEKCLYATEAPFYIGAGFTGRRVDHALAVFHAMLRYPEKTVVLIGEAEAIALVPASRRIQVELPLQTVVSLYPLCPVKAVWSDGLAWPVDGMNFAPGHQIGTSNHASKQQVGLQVDGPGLLMMIPAEHLPALLFAMTGDSA